MGAKDVRFHDGARSKLVAGVNILADAVKSVDWRARNAKYTDTAPAEVMEAVLERLQALLGLDEP